MSVENSRLDRESRTMARMVSLYCRAHHAASGADLCGACQDFLDYAKRRLSKCPYGDGKPTCSNCPVHCYKPAQREVASQIMRFAGPRMLIRHPLLAIAHKLDGFRKVGHPRELTRNERLHTHTEQESTD